MALSNTQLLYRIRCSGSFFLPLANFGKQNQRGRGFSSTFTLQENINFKLAHFSSNHIAKYDAVGFSLYVTKKDCDELTAEYNVSLINNSGQKVYGHHGFKVFNASQPADEFILLQWDQFEAEKDNLLHNGKLIVFCEMKVLERKTQEMASLEHKLKVTNKRLDLKRIQIVNSKQKTHNSRQKVVGMAKRAVAYEHLLKSGDHSDVVLVVDGKQFRAHKLILAFQSPVFARMFDNDMREAHEARVEIVDIDPVVLKQLLNFMYTGKVENMKKYATRLYQTSEKYQLTNLKAKCELYLFNSVNVQNVCETLLLADLHLSDKLKARCVKFIKKNSTKVKATEGWKCMIANRADLALEFGLNL